MSGNVDDLNTAAQVADSSTDEKLAVNNSKVIANNDHQKRDYKHDDDDDDDDHVLRDVIMWRRKEMSAVVVLVSTVVWVLLQLYGFNFLPLVCWMLMAFATLLFCYGFMLRLFRKEASYMTRWEMRVTEQRAKEMGDSAKKMMEKSIRLMFYVSCEREWYIFLGVVSTLFLLAYVGSYIDLITLLYTGTMMVMTIPVIYAKKEDVIKAYGKKMKQQGVRMYHMFDDKVFSKLNLQREVKKEKKVE